MESRKNVRVLFLSVQKATTATFPPTRENESGLIVLDLLPYFLKFQE
jgi:hypothetical protein